MWVHGRQYRLEYTGTAAETSCLVLDVGSLFWLWMTSLSTLRSYWTLKFYLPSLHWGGGWNMKAHISKPGQIQAKLSTWLDTTKGTVNENVLWVCGSLLLPPAMSLLTIKWPVEGSAVMASFWKVLAWTSSSSSLRSFSPVSSSSSSSRLWEKNDGWKETKHKKSLAQRRGEYRHRDYIYMHTRNQVTGRLRQEEISLYVYEQPGVATCKLLWHISLIKRNVVHATHS